MYIYMIDGIGFDIGSYGLIPPPGSLRLKNNAGTKRVNILITETLVRGYLEILIKWQVLPISSLYNDNEACQRLYRKIESVFNTELFNRQPSMTNVCLFIIGCCHKYERLVYLSMLIRHGRHQRVEAYGTRMVPSRGLRAASQYSTTPAFIYINHFYRQHYILHKLFHTSSLWTDFLCHYVTGHL